MINVNSFPCFLSICTACVRASEHASIHSFGHESCSAACQSVVHCAALPTPTGLDYNFLRTYKRNAICALQTGGSKLSISVRCVCSWIWLSPGVRKGLPNLSIQGILRNHIRNNSHAQDTPLANTLILCLLQIYVPSIGYAQSPGRGSYQSYGGGSWQCTGSATPRVGNDTSVFHGAL
jgi:hypothetical protein